ncbi:ABC transporter substrate-binding protein [Candidatus Acetothermia bacterium]|nr:MAG: ABC transporter substrate-binding protein [Candidatus Acetothermia bacterium]
MRKWVLGLLIFGLAAGLVAAQEAKVITIKAWTVGPDDPSITRKLNLEAAVERLNKYLEVVGADIRVEIEATFVTTSWSDYKRANLLALQSGDPAKIADIIITGHEDIGPYAEAGYIVPLDDFIAKYPEVYEDFFPALWESCKYKGKIWGIPQDTEARMFYYRKDLLKAAGYSEEFIESIPAKVTAGEFTLDDIIALGQKLLEAGVVDETMAIWHRPTPGTDWFQFIYAFGGELYDPATGKLVVDKSATLALFKFMKKLVDLKLTPGAMSQISWPEIHSNFSGGKVGINLTGGSWNFAEWQHDPYNKSFEYLWENIGFAPIPAAEKGGKPVSVSHPLVHVITAASQHKELAFLIVTLASAVDLNTRHALQSGHLAIRRSQLSYAPYAADVFAKTVSELCAPFARFSPNHPKAPFYWEALFRDGIVPVEVGALSPEAALENFIKRVQTELGDQVIIRE